MTIELATEWLQLQYGQNMVTAPQPPRQRPRSRSHWLIHPASLPFLRGGQSQGSPRYDRDPSSVRIVGVSKEQPRS